MEKIFLSKLFALSSKEKAFFFFFLPITIRKQSKVICNTRIQSKRRELGDKAYSRKPKGKARVPELGSIERPRGRKEHAGKEGWQP